MIRNYFKIAFRSLFKNKVYSFINIFGLAVGIACCLLIGLYIQNEWSYDSFHSNSDRLYRAWTHEDYGNDEIYFNSITPAILAPTLENNIPEVASAARLYNFSSFIKRPDQDASVSETVSMIDPAFLEMFDFPLLQGNPDAIFNNPGSVVLTQQAARHYFGDENPLQKVLSLQIDDEFQDFVVTGIIEDTPTNSSIRLNILIPFSNSSRLFGEGTRTSWFNVSTETYVLLDENTDSEQLKPKLASMMVSALGERYGDDLNESGLIYTVGLQPITDIHLNTDIPKGIAPVSDPTYSYILAAIAILILLIACVNFMTLSISRSTSRAKEVGIRKTIGAERKHLMFQFWGEAFLMTVIALSIGAFIAELLLPRFNALSGTELQMVFGANLLIALLFTTVIISLVAGIYPALIISGFKPVQIFKGKVSLSKDKQLFRQTMVAFQFTLSIALIAGTLIISSQLDYMRSKDLGYQKDQVVVLNTGLYTGPENPMEKVLEDAGRLKDRLESELSGYPEISQISVSSFTPVEGGGWIGADFKESNGRKHEFHFNIIDHDFVETYGIQILHGRDFSEENPSDERQAILVNQALADEYGWENSVGQHLPGPNFENHEIVGVIENFNYQSLHSAVEPLVLTMNPELIFSGIDNVNFSASPVPRISIQLASQNLPELMAHLEDTWNTLAEGTPFNYTFVDQAVDNQYRQEQRLNEIVQFGSILAIVIACLGLFGLASLMIIRRTKEIGVRKVLGASTSSIVLLVNKEFIKLVGIAFIIAVPIIWYIMSKWLQNFAYKTDVGIGIFAIAGLIVGIIALLTVSWQSIKAALMNPVNSLRSE